MDAKTALMSVPMLRKAWRVVPGPLRVPLLVVGAIIWFVRRDKGGSADGDGAEATTD